MGFIAFVVQAEGSRFKMDSWCKATLMIVSTRRFVVNWVFALSGPGSGDRRGPRRL